MFNARGESLAEMPAFPAKMALHKNGDMKSPSAKLKNSTSEKHLHQRSEDRKNDHVADQIMTPGQNSDLPIRKRPNKGQTFSLV
uniref:Uncharacterized protein n=1 Tax=Strigamia maritima TaxID=126957 RepID=T1JK36_STRMM